MHSNALLELYILSADTLFGGTRVPLITITPIDCASQWESRVGQGTCLVYYPCFCTTRLYKINQVYPIAFCVLNPTSYLPAHSTAVRFIAGDICYMGKLRSMALQSRKKVSFWNCFLLPRIQVSTDTSLLCCW